MGLTTKGQVQKVIYITGIFTILSSIMPLTDLFADSIKSSTLSPQVIINQNSFSNPLRELVVESYISQSILSEFEYRSLKLDVIFSSRINPAEIEKELMQLISKSDLLFYFSEEDALASKRFEIRMKVRNIFQIVLEKYGVDLFSMQGYQDKIMGKLFEAHMDEMVSYHGEYFLKQRIWQIVRDLSPEEILVFKENPSAPNEHALKGDIKVLLEAGLNEEGFVFNQEIWGKVAEAVKRRRNTLVGNFSFYIKKYDKEFKKRLIDKFSMRDIAYYFADTAGFNLPRQQARREIYKFFMEWLEELDSRSESEINPHMIRLPIYNEGTYWKARYQAALDNIVTQMLEIDADSYDISLLKMLGQEVNREKKSDINKTIDIITRATNGLLDELKQPYNLYSRIAARNDKYEKRVYIDHKPVIEIRNSASGQNVFISDGLYLINDGQAVLYQPVKAQKGKNEVFIFAGKATRSEVIRSQNTYSQLKGAGQKVNKNDPQSIKKALSIILRGQNNILKENKEKWNIYHRIRAVNQGSSQFAMIDEEIVAGISEGIGGNNFFADNQLYFIGKEAVLYQKNNPKTGETEVFIFNGEAPDFCVELKPLKNDYSKVFRDNLKRFLVAKFESWRLKIFQAYVWGDLDTWNAHDLKKAYTIPKKINKACEEFFWLKHKIKMGEEERRLIIDVINEHLNGKNTLTSSEVEFLDLALPFSPVNGLMRLNRLNYGIFPLPRKQLFQLQTEHLYIGQGV